MRRLAFIITLLGILTLLIILTNSNPFPLYSPEQLSSLQNNQKVSLSGLVISFLNKTISAIAIIDTYQKTRIKALKITEK
jgi:heme/copper-type cytochrome/quinol oxidase subunit 1